MNEDPRVHGSRPVKGLSGPRVCAWDANEVARLFDKQRRLLLAQSGLDWAKSSHIALQLRQGSRQANRQAV